MHNPKITLKLHTYFLIAYTFLYSGFAGSVATCHQYGVFDLILPMGSLYVLYLFKSFQIQLHHYLHLISIQLLFNTLIINTISILYESIL